MGAVEHRRPRRSDGRDPCGAPAAGVPGSGDGSACPVDNVREALVARAPSTPRGQVSTDLSPAVGRSGVERLRRATRAATGGPRGTRTGAGRGRSCRAASLRRCRCPVSRDAACRICRSTPGRRPSIGRTGIGRGAGDQRHTGQVAVVPEPRGMPLGPECRFRGDVVDDQGHSTQAWGAPWRVVCPSRGAGRLARRVTIRGTRRTLGRREACVVCPSRGGSVSCRAGDASGHRRYAGRCAACVVCPSREGSWTRALGPMNRGTAGRPGARRGAWCAPRR